VKATGAVRCWGSNDYGQLGNGSTSTTPIGVASATTPIASGAVAIAAGERHTCAMKSDGTVWCWGYNGSGQLGDNTKVDKSTPVQVTTF
jgi:alpha-tubulin suppressor-like RCC1 family protein